MMMLMNVKCQLIYSMKILYQDEEEIGEREISMLSFKIKIDKREMIITVDVDGTVPLYGF